MFFNSDTSREIYITDIGQKRFVIFSITIIDPHKRTTFSQKFSYKSALNDLRMQI